MQQKRSFDQKLNKSWLNSDFRIHCIENREEIKNIMQINANQKFLFLISNSTLHVPVLLKEIGSPTKIKKLSVGYKCVQGIPIDESEIITVNETKLCWKYGCLFTENFRSCNHCFIEGNITKSLLCENTHAVDKIKKPKGVKNCLLCIKRAIYGCVNESTKLWCVSCKPQFAVRLDSKKCFCGNSVAYYALPGEIKAKYCSKCKVPNAVDVVHTRCVCGKSRQSFAVTIDQKAQFCKICKTKDAVDVVSKRCACGILATFTDKGGHTRKYCFACKPSNSISNNKHCLCGLSQPSYALPGETERKYCIKCKPITAVYVHKKCFCGLANPSLRLPDETQAKYCGKCKPSDAIIINKMCKCGASSAQFGFPGQSVKYCSLCKTENTVNLRKRRCNCGSNLVPIYNVKKDTKPQFCYSCKQDDMINVTQPRCKNCDKMATYGFIGQNAEYCATCKIINTIYQPRKRCVFKKCKEVATYGIRINQRLHCENHHIENEKNFFEKNCKSCGLQNVLDQADLCQYCNSETFKYFKLRKENEIVTLLIANGIKFTYNKIANGTKCGRERCDIVIQCEGYIVILEIDENQHKPYSCECEQIRMINVTQSYGGMPCFWIRYNPDKFSIQHENQDITQNQRHQKLLEWIKYAQNRKMENLGEVMYLCYDNCNKKTFNSEVFVLPQN